jgi:hypothetical protein
MVVLPAGGVVRSVIKVSPDASGEELIDHLDGLRVQSRVLRLLVVDGHDHHLRGRGRERRQAMHSVRRLYYSELYPLSLQREMVVVYLNGGNARRKNQALVVSVHHGEHTQSPGRETPRVLPGVELVSRLIGILELNAEHLGEVLAQAVGCRSLNGTSHR